MIAVVVVVIIIITTMGKEIQTQFITKYFSIGNVKNQLKNHALFETWQKSCFSSTFVLKDSPTHSISSSKAANPGGHPRKQRPLCE